MHVLPNLLAREKRRHVFEWARFEGPVGTSKRRSFWRNPLLWGDHHFAKRGAIVSQHSTQSIFQFIVGAQPKMPQAVSCGQLLEVRITDTGSGIGGYNSPFEQRILRCSN